MLILLGVAGANEAAVWWDAGGYGWGGSRGLCRGSEGDFAVSIDTHLNTRYPLLSFRYKKLANFASDFGKINK